jgi:hypothetical protein
MRHSSAAASSSLPAGSSLVLFLAYVLVATVVSYLFSEGPRDARGRSDRKLRGTVTGYRKRPA